jgi:thiamine-phosphate pyrophosphorylase
MPLTPPLVCVVTRARGASGTPERARLLDRLSVAAAAGASMIQVRERQLDDRRLLAFVQEVTAAVRASGALVLVNDRTDVALAAGADGVHLKSDAPSAAAVRQIVPSGFVIGRSIHTVRDARAAADAGGCDYLLFGTVFPSRSKQEDHPIAGVEALRQVCLSVQLPVLAIGGITETRADDVAAAGASGVAAISLFAESRDVAATVGALRRALTGSPGRV